METAQKTFTIPFGFTFEADDDELKWNPLYKAASQSSPAKSPWDSMKRISSLM